MCQRSAGRADGRTVPSPPVPSPRRFAAPRPHAAPEGRPAHRPPALGGLRRARRLAVPSGGAGGRRSPGGRPPRGRRPPLARRRPAPPPAAPLPRPRPRLAAPRVGGPRIAAGYRRLDSLELVPFRAGISAGADVVMSAHIVVPDLTGPEQPATLAAAVLTGLLRDSLGFQGLVVTDALDMGAIVSKYGAGEAAVGAFVAGADLLLIPADPDSAASALAAAVASGRITAARLDASVRRVLQVKQRLGLFERRLAPLDSIMPVVGSKRFQDAANDMAVRSLTLVRDIGGPLHALRAKRSRFALVAYGDELNSFVGQRILELLRQGGDTVDFFRLWPMSGTPSYDSARAVIARAPAVVFAANVRPISGRGTIALPDSLAQLMLATDTGRPTVVVSLGSPYLLSQAPTVKSYLIAWSGVRASERAVALALLGKVPITGRLPISLPPAYRIGGGIVIPDARP